MTETGQGISAKDVVWNEKNMGELAMRNQRILKKAAKKTISWLLILGMMVTLPQLPVDMVYAAETNEAVIEAETETEEAGLQDTEATETELQDTETETAAVEEEEASEEAENKAAATSTNVTIHFKNENNWDKVYAKFGAGDSWDAIANYEYCKSTAFGGVVNANSKNAGWYTFKVVKSDTLDINGLFNSGAWGAGKQTDNFKVEITDDTMEVWITGNTVSATAPSGWVAGETATAPVDPATLSSVKSPVLNVDGSVTLNYEISADKLGTSKLYLMGNLTDWDTGAEMKDEDNDGVYSITISDKAPGTYEYKFKYGENWVTDPANTKFSNGNSVVTIPGLGEDGIEAVIGEKAALPETLKLYAADGTVSDVAVSYSLSSAVEGVTLSGNELTLSDAVTAASFEVTAAYQSYTSKVTVSVVAEQYQYHIYYYADNPDRVTADSAALWLYGKNVDGALYNFTDVEEIDGYTWLKTTWTTS